eukprot:6180773-Pleurochrysis_carterae.AAC.1
MEAGTSSCCTHLHPCPPTFLPVQPLLPRTRSLHDSSPASRGPFLPPPLSPLVLCSLPVCAALRRSAYKQDHQADEKMLRANRGKPSAEQRRSRSQQATLAKEVSTRLYNHGAEKREKWERESQGALLEMRKAKLYPVSQLTFQQKDQLYRRSYPALRPTIDNVLTRTSK